MNHESSVPEYKESPNAVKIALIISDHPSPVSKKRNNNPILLVKQLKIKTLILPNLSAKIPDGNSEKKLQSKKRTEIHLYLRMYIGYVA